MGPVSFAPICFAARATFLNEMGNGMDDYYRLEAQFGILGTSSSLRKRSWATRSSKHAKPRHENDALRHDQPLEASPGRVQPRYCQVAPRRHSRHQAADPRHNSRQPGLPAPDCAIARARSLDVSARSWDAVCTPSSSDGKGI